MLYLSRIGPREATKEVAFFKRFARAPTTVAAIAAMLYLASAQVALAGFGVTPPYVNNARLTRGSVYEQRILLVRSDPVDDLQTEITITVPGAQEWITVDQGTKFIMPKGAAQVPIMVRVQVPQDAEFKEYTGTIRVRTAPLTENLPAGGGVSIALGAQINVNLNVVEKIYDFEVRKIRIAELEEGRTLWGLYFPGKIRFYITVKNTGNVEFGPTKVCFDIYDSSQETMLERVCNTNKIKKVAPFATEEVVAELPTRLPPGSYTVKYTVYKNEEVAQQNQASMSILPVGTLPDYRGYGFDGLSLPDKIKAIAYVLVPLTLLVVIVLVVLRWRRKVRARREAYTIRR